jgi:hypothetical protein
MSYLNEPLSFDRPGHHAAHEEALQGKEDRQGQDHGDKGA